MTMAKWNGMKWGVSKKEIACLEGLSTGYSINDEGKAEPQSISLSTTYRVETGTKNIRKKMSEWESLLGKYDVLLIGGSKFGPKKLQLKSINVSDVHINAHGDMRSATLSFTFQEYESTKSGVATTKKTSGNTTTKKTSGKTGLYVGASADDKKKKKTVTATKKDNKVTVIKKKS